VRETWIATSRRCAAVAAVLAVALAPAGCGDGAPRRVSVSGSVTLDGKPLPVGRVKFVVTNPAGTYEAVAEVRDGRYQADGIYSGDARVSVSTKVYEIAAKFGGKHDPKKRGGDFPTLPEGVTAVTPVPVRYDSEATSGLTCKVDDGLVYDIKMTTR
jgi:hypothetical protein